MNDPRPSGNTEPTLVSVLGKLEHPGSLFASDEVWVLTQEIEKLRLERDQAVAAMRAIQRKNVRTDKA